MKNILKSILIYVVLTVPNISKAEIILHTGISNNFIVKDTGIGEQSNQSNMFRLYVGTDNEKSNIGFYIGRSYNGDDNKNVYTGIDYNLTYQDFIRFGIGLTYTSKPIRTIGQNFPNFHLQIGFLNKDLFKENFGAGIFLDHWSNCRRICNYRLNEIHNPPRNVINFGLIKSFSNN